MFLAPMRATGILFLPQPRLRDFYIIFLSQLMEHNTVGHIDLHRRSIHDHRSMLQINMEESHRITFMIQRHQKLIIREKLRILRLLTADRQQEVFLQKSCLLIYIKYDNGIIPCDGTEQIIVIQ